MSPKPSQVSTRVVDISESLSRFWTVLAPLYVGIRICLANRLPITDCDETFNYWEVVHYLLYGTKNIDVDSDSPGDNNNSSIGMSDDGVSVFPGYQTWEYSNTFALRTYAYLLPLVALGRFYDRILQRSNYLPLLSSSSSSPLSLIFTLLAPQQDVTSTKVAIFILLRASLGAWMAIGEISFCRVLSLMGTRRQYMTTTSSSSSKATTTARTVAMVGILTAFLLLTSAGMGHSAAALLPSSTVMGIWMYAAAAFLENRDVEFCALAVVATLAVGWPFGVLVFIPLGVTVLIRRYNTSWTSLFGLIAIVVALTFAVQTAVMTIDYQHYERVVSPVWNILVYNTKEGGDELYGTEPWTYYVKNLLLNLNYIAPLGIFGPLLTGLIYSCIPACRKSMSISVPYLMAVAPLLLPMYLWLGVVMPRPHKEERFLFPIYPCICFGAAFSSILLVQLSVTTFQKLFIIKGSPTVATAVANKDHGHSNQLIGFKSFIVVALLWIPSMIISQTRLMALSTYYAGPLIVYSKIANVVSSTKTPANVVDTNLMICTCGEWYRFPSSFYLPMKTKFSFAPSSFTGQLPQPFTVHGSRPSAPTIFNDENLPESGSLINDFTLCDYMVDVSSSSDCLTLAGDDDQSQWSPRIKAPFLHAEQTTNVLHRTLFIPFLHEKARERGDVRYADYVLYEKSRRQDAH